MTPQEFQNRYVYNTATDCLGRGGFGSVYKAYDNILSRYVAIKISPVDPLRAELRLRAEVEKAFGLLHPNIAHYEECYTFSYPTGEYDFAVMQFYEDGSLENLILENIISKEDCYDILKQILNGILFLHNNNIIHRDLKPQNILIVRHNETYIPKITDFGISKKLDDGESSAVSNSVLGGTRAYASPEQLAERQIRKNSDLWSFGIIAFRMLTGTMPFNSGKYSSTSEQGRQEMYRQMLSGILPNSISMVEEPWRTVIQKCLIPNNEIRIHHADECIEIISRENGSSTCIETDICDIVEIENVEEPILLCQDDNVKEQEKEIGVKRDDFMQDANIDSDNDDVSENLTEREKVVDSLHLNHATKTKQDGGSIRGVDISKTIKKSNAQIANDNKKSKSVAYKKSRIFILVGIFCLLIVSGLLFFSPLKSTSYQPSNVEDFSDMIAAGLGRNGVYQVGDYYNQDSLQGVVFYVTEDGRHGKIISFEESDKIKWCTNFNSQRQMSTGAISVDDGKMNTDTIMSRQDSEDLFPAFAWCKNLGEMWYLPSREEWETIRTHRHLINATMYRHNCQFKNAWYWTSTEWETESNFAWACGFPSESPRTYRKNGETYVRAAAYF